MFIVIDVGCMECQLPTKVIRVCADQTEAILAAEEAARPYALSRYGPGRDKSASRIQCPDGGNDNSSTFRYGHWFGDRSVEVHEI